MAFLHGLFPKTTYCINLKSRTDRWENVSKEFEKADMHPYQFEAIENKQNPAAGCRQSHLAILKDAQKKNENAYIFEDDMEFIDKNIPFISNVFSELKKIEWDMVFFGGNLLRPAFQVTDHLARLSHCYSTHAYGVSKNFYKFIIPIIESNEGFPIDVLYGDYIIPNSKCFIAVPMICIQADNYSDILKQKIDYSVPMQRYDHFLIKNEKFAT